MFLSVNEMQFPPSAQSWPGVPGWGIALLVLVCILVALAIIYLIALVSLRPSPMCPGRWEPMGQRNLLSPQAVCQCRRKNYGHLDIFPTQDTYHPMSEYPTYHTHGRYVPPGSTKRNPYEEVNLGPTGWGKGPGWVRVSGEVLGKPKVLQRGEQGRAWRGGGGR